MFEVGKVLILLIVGILLIVSIPGAFVAYLSMIAFGESIQYAFAAYVLVYIILAILRKQNPKEENKKTKLLWKAGKILAIALTYSLISTGIIYFWVNFTGGV